MEERIGLLPVVFRYCENYLRGYEVGQSSVFQNSVLNLLRR